MTTMLHYGICCICALMLVTVAQGTSLWNTQAASPYADTRARAVGDLLTVIIVQESRATTESRHATGKDMDVNAGAGRGWLRRFPGFGVKAGRTTNGSGSASAATRLLDRVTVRVVEALPGGTLRIEGIRTIKLEQDEMTLIFRGTVRQEDIQPDNTVSSILIAEQELETRGSGPIAEKQRTGLLSSLLSFLW